MSLPPLMNSTPSTVRTPWTLNVMPAAVAVAFLSRVMVVALVLMTRASAGMRTPTEDTIPDSDT